MKDRSTAPISPFDAATVARLEAHLADQAASMRLPEPPVGTVVARAAQRRVNRRASLGALSAAALVGAVLIGAQALIGEDGRRTVVITDETPVTEPPAPKRPRPPIESTTVVAGLETRQVPSTLSWVTVDPDPESDAALAAVYDNIGGTGPLVSWTYQEQPAADYVSNLYISTDGINWRATATSPSLSITDATATGSGSPSSAKRRRRCRSRTVIWWWRSRTTPAPPGSTCRCRCRCDGCVTNPACGWSARRTPRVSSSMVTQLSP